MIRSGVKEKWVVRDGDKVRYNMESGGRQSEVEDLRSRWMVLTHRRLGAGGKGW